MIELRYVRREIEDGNLGAYIDTVLQYRTWEPTIMNDPILGIDIVRGYDWPEWQDVPTVNEEG